jgi:2-dehydropantoate 2-reductase
MNDALFELRNNLNSNIVIMANNIKNYSEFESIVGAKKIIPAFPGAGGSIKSGVLHYRIVPKLIQRTIFGEIDGSKSVRIQKLTRIMHNSKIPYDVSKNMLAWQRSHVAMITALEMGIYFDGGDNYTTADDDAALNYICNSLKRNFCYLKKLKVRITPCWFNLFNLSPNYVIKVFLKTILSTKFAKTGIYSNKKSSKMEMEMLEKEFLKWVESEKNE